MENFELVPVDSNSQTESKANGLSLVGSYDQIQVKNGAIKLTLEVPLTDNLSKMERLSNGVNQTAAVYIQFRQDELEVD
ncbi:hypothetical protein [Oenococcus oeni]|uniref:hypothetical protein n=1 Tax=Oenococcus oeni TaxID=1247 RepID=UPI0010B50A42|nr:hypothetical protein [Oenococcus oeni]SYW19503.1 hypothetical protein OENI_160051 [Oenococcus oeni]